MRTSVFCTRIGICILQLPLISDEWLQRFFYFPISPLHSKLKTDLYCIPLIVCGLSLQLIDQRHCFNMIVFKYLKMVFLIFSCFYLILFELFHTLCPKVWCSSINYFSRSEPSSCCILYLSTHVCVFICVNRFS